LRKYIIRDVRQAFAALHLWLVQTNALCCGVRTRAMHVLVMYPKGRRNVRCEIRLPSIHIRNDTKKKEKGDASYR
jgi:hypothetical protein